MNACDFEVGDILGYFSGTKVRPCFLAQKNPPKGSASPNGTNSYFLSERFPYFDHPTIEEVVWILKIDEQMLTVA